MRAHGRLAGCSPQVRTGHGEVLRLVAGGLLNKQIAAALGVSVSTLQSQRVRALQKLRASTVADVVRLMALAGDDGAT